MYNILLVDDEEDLLLLSKEFLSIEDSSFEIDTISSADDALRKIAETKFDIVVSDYQMPGMDGLELLERIRSNNNDIPFIIFTGRGREEVAIQALNLGANYYIRKGGEPKSQYTELAHVIKSVIQHRRAEDELIRAEQELRVSEKKHRELVEKMLEGVLVEDAEGFITFVNPRVTELLGYTKKELFGRHHSTIVAASELDKVWEETTKRIHGMSSIYEATLRTQNGKHIPVIISATPLFTDTKEFNGVLSVFTDISKRKQMERALQKAHDELEKRVKIRTQELQETNTKLRKEILERNKMENALRESEKKYQFLFHNAPVGIGISDVGGTVIDANRTMIRMMGYSPDEVETINVPDVYSNPQERLKLIKAVQKSGFVKDWETSLIRKDDTVFPALLNIEQTKFGEKNVLFTTVRDITKRKEVEIALRVELERANENLKQEIAEYEHLEKQISTQKKKMRAFFHSMIHDLSNSLTIVHGYAELLEKNDYKKSNVEVIKNKAWDMRNQLVKSLELLNTGLYEADIKNIDLNQLIEQIAETIIPKHVIFSHNDLPTVICDQERVTQIFKGLFKNAVLHGDPKKIVVKRNITDDGILILVENDGKPIPQETRREIFLQTSPTKRGITGLKLPLIKKIAEEHGWEMGLDSSPETKFRIFIPSTQIKALV